MITKNKVDFAIGVRGYGTYDASGALISGWRAASSACIAAATLAMAKGQMHYAVNERTAEIIGISEGRRLSFR